MPLTIVLIHRDIFPNGKLDLWGECFSTNIYSLRERSQDLPLATLLFAAGIALELRNRI
jgi:hypothetical protein